MRVYFLSYLPAALKLNGLYLGTIDGFERHIELDPKDGVLAEIVPCDNLQPLNFFLDEKFFNDPPKYTDVYLTEGDAIIFIREYAIKDVKLDVVYQTRFYGNLITIFSQGGIYLSAEGAEYSLSPLPLCFSSVRAEQRTLAGREVLAICGGNSLLVISDNGKTIFLNVAENAEFGENLTVTVPFETCAAAKAVCDYTYDGEALTLISSRTVETRTPEKEILHFAFFESVMTRGDFAKYLSDELKTKAGDLKSYLGEFVSVAVPPEKFYLIHGNLPAAGLVYPKSGNLYEVKYFAVEFNEDKISNIYPV